MSAPDFEKMALAASALLYDETGSPMPEIVETRLAETLRYAYAAGLERAAEGCLGRTVTSIADAIEAARRYDHD